ncbi:MCE family protein [Gordonia rubripertincta]|uniref:MCE family protein n=1 Tax=Gordonia rubripertincta TaxID=36822 RepID=UPI000B8D5469|nr:MCE family protein [Gordonia rubripertincta]ASR03097.1 mce related protein [Gordonia rubripertincta]
MRRLNGLYQALFATVRRGIVTVAAAIILLALAIWAGTHFYQAASRTNITAYFTNTNGIYVGDDVYVLGIKVGAIDSITPQGDRVRVGFHYDSSVNVPADAKAVILAPSLVSSRAIQLAPGYTGGNVMLDGAEIPLDRTAVPVEWDDFRKQLKTLSDSLGPTADAPNGPLGSVINATAEALNGQGDALHDTITKLSQAMTTISDGRKDLFSVVRNLQVFVSALASSDEQIVQFNGHLASVTRVLDNTDNELSNALADVDSVTGDLQQFIADNRDQLQHTVDGLAQVTTALNDVKPTVEQVLHVAPNAFANLINIYQPAQGALTGALAVSQFQNPVQFICGAIQAASQLGAQESANLCVQYLGPVLKSLAFNYPPIGANIVAGVQARKDQVDYSEPFLNPNLGSTVKTPRANPRAGLAGLLSGGGS